jgi:hypothetical protein
MRLLHAVFVTGLMGMVQYPAAGQEAVLDFTGTWQANIGPKGGPPTYMTFAIKQEGSTVIITHLDGYLTTPRGAEIFRGAYQDMKITSRRQNQKGEWVVKTVTVNDPDEFLYDGGKFLRMTYPPPGNPACEPSNQFHVKAKYAYSRGYQLSNAKKFDQANCWFRISADLGDSAGVQGLAYAYWMGEGVPKDYKKAAELDQIAAEQGNVFAQGELATAYANGDGVEKDPQKAASWKAKADAQWKEIRARKAASLAEQQASMKPFLMLSGLVNRVLGPFDGRPAPSTTAAAPPPSNGAPRQSQGVAAKPAETLEARTSQPAEVTITVKGMAGGSDDLHIFGAARTIPEGTPFTLVYTFDDSKGQAYAPGNCPDWGSGITGGQKESPGTAVLTIGGRSFTFGKGPNVKSSVWRKVTTRCSRSEIAMEMSEGQFPNFTGVNTRAHAPAGTNSLTQTKDWRTAVLLDSVDANDPNNVFGIALPNRTGTATRGVLRVKSIEVSGPRPVTSASSAGLAPAAAPKQAPAAAAEKIERGQTIEQVLAQLGQPVTTATAGATQIYLFKKWKVTFINGKVSEMDAR